MPARHVWTFTQQASPLTFGHAAPYSPLKPVIQGLSKAFRTDATVSANTPSSALLFSVREEGICHTAAICLECPIVSFIASHELHGTRYGCLLTRDKISELAAQWTTPMPLPVRLLKTQLSPP